MDISDIPDREYNLAKQSVAKQLDSYVNQYGDQNPMWVVKLSNGETVYQDDDRPEREPQSAWARLKIYCEENGIHITNMKIKNRSNVQDVGSDFDGYFFCKCAGAYMFGDNTIHSFVVGGLNDGKLRVRKWVMPEMTPERFEDRDIKKSQECLIVKKEILNGEELQTHNKRPRV